MKTEKIILSFVAVLVGLLAAGVAFYFYQNSKTSSNTQIQPTAVPVRATPTAIPADNNLMIIDIPKDESVVDKKLVTIVGHTQKDAIVTISTEEDDQVIKPAENGSFTITVTVPTGTSSIRMTALLPNGQEKTVTRTVTYSTESF